MAKYLFRNRQRRRGPLPLRYVILLTFVFFTFSTVAGLWIINKSLEPTLMSYAESESVNIATAVINDAVDKELNSKKDNNIFRTIPNTNGSKNFQIDTNKVNQLQTAIVTEIQNNLKHAEQGKLSSIAELPDVTFKKKKSNKDGIIYSIPLGKVTDNVLLGNLGPDIPIEFSAIGDVEADTKTKIVEFGINSANIEVFIKIVVNIEIIIPFSSETTVVTRNIPIGMGVFQNDVPQFYDGSGKTSPSIQMPNKE